MGTALSFFLLVVFPCFAVKHCLDVTAVATLSWFLEKLSLGLLDLFAWLCADMVHCSEACKCSLGSIAHWANRPSGVVFYKLCNIQSCLAYLCTWVTHPYHLDNKFLDKQSKLEETPLAGFPALPVASKVSR